MNKKQQNKQTELATTNEKLYKNCKIVKLYEKKGGATDWQNKDGEVQSDSNRALCDIRRSSWRGIVKLPHNRESDWSIRFSWKKYLLSQKSALQWQIYRKEVMPEFFYSFINVSIVNFATAKWFCRVTCFVKVFLLFFLSDSFMISLS